MDKRAKENRVLQSEFDDVALRWIALYDDENKTAESSWWPIWRKSLKWRMQKVIEELGDVSEKNVLELGCGGGHYGAILSSKKAKWIGLDFSFNMLLSARSLVRSTGHDAKVVQADVFDLPIKTQAIDRLLCIGVIGYYPERRLTNLFLEFNRVLKLGEIFIAQSPHPLTSWFRSLFPSRLPRSYSHRPAYLAQLMKKTGFEVVKIIKIPKYKIMTAGWIYVTRKISSN